MPVWATQRNSLKKRKSSTGISLSDRELTCHVRCWAQSPRQQKGRTRTIIIATQTGANLKAVHIVCMFWSQPNTQSHSWADIWGSSVICPQILYEPDTDQQIHQVHQAPSMLPREGKCFWESLGHSNSSSSCVPPLCNHSLARLPHSPRLHISTPEWWALSSM